MATSLSRQTRRFVSEQHRALEADLLAARVGLSAVSIYAGGSVPRLESAAIDLSVLGFSALACGLSAFVVGLAPALEAARTDLTAALGNVRGSEARRQRRSRDGLIAVQLAVALVLA